VNIISRDEETRLLELLGEEQKLFEQIHGLTVQQAELLAADDIEAFDKSLDSRQELIEKINGLHQETNILMQSYISFSGSPGGMKSAAAEAALESLRDKISLCAELNEKNMAAAKEMAEDYIKRIGKLSLSRKSLGAYALSVPNNSELFDKKT